MMNTADRVEFTKEMRDYTILAPNMADIHFSLLINIFSQYGYRVELLKNDGRTVVDEGLKYVHNDTCYPALLVIGQLIDALNTGKYDPDRFDDNSVGRRLPCFKLHSSAQKSA